MASEASFYRLLRAHDQVHRRTRAQAPQQRAKPAAVAADASNQAGSWDITYLPSPIRGPFHRLCMVVDIYSRLIVA